MSLPLSQDPCCCSVNAGYFSQLASCGSAAVGVGALLLLAARVDMFLMNRCLSEAHLWVVIRY